MRELKMTPELRQILERARATFIAKFGREPGPGDPVFFDPDADVPTPLNPEKMRADLVRAMRRAGIAKSKQKELLRRWDNNEPLFDR
jgi:hypothetical protein